jgi:hypothetical protein
VAQWLVTEAGYDVRSEWESDHVSCRCSCFRLWVFLRREDDYLCLVRRCDQGPDGARSALRLACFYGHLDVVKWLVTDADCDASGAACRCCLRVGKALYKLLLRKEKKVAGFSALRRSFSSAFVP